MSEFDKAQDGRRKRNRPCYTTWMGGNVKKTTVDTSLLEEVVAALMIVGKADLAEIMAVAKKPPAGTKRSGKPETSPLRSMPREPQWRVGPRPSQEDCSAKNDRFRLRF
jgi:hypothetical protein